METPKRRKNCQVAIPSVQFEDSPVFNFLNNLSPIKPVKPMHITQSINPLTFASLPSVFSSPHLTSLKESRFLRRHHLSDPSKPEFSSDDSNTADPNNDVQVAMNSDQEKENLDPLDLRPSDGCSKLVVEFAESLTCDSDIMNSSLSCLKSKDVAEYACTSSALGENQKSVEMVEANREGLSNIDQNEWESLIADASDLLFSESPNLELHNKSVDPATTFYRSIKNAIQNAQSLGSEVCGEQRVRVREGSGEGTEMIENGGTNDIASDSSFSNPNHKMDYENLSGLYRGIRRRCLVFEGGQRKHMEEGSPSDASALLKPDTNPSSNQQIVRGNAENNSSRSLPGIGLHLNAVAATPKDFKIVNHDSSSSGRLLIGTSSSTNFPLSSSQELLTNYSLQREIDTFENRGLDPIRESGYVANEDINPGSPKKRRRRLEQTGDGGSCKRCNCKKSKCLKLYCECFAAGVYCVEPCACIDCFNKPVHVDMVLTTRKQIESRNPLAFAPKVIRGSDSTPDIRDDFTNTPASARHKRGCNCKKSGCLKKYCECYQGGVGCSINCRCEGCKNAFGRKDGSGTSPAEHEHDDDETDLTENASFDTTLFKCATHDDLEQSMASQPHSTSLETIMQPYQSFSKKRPPRATLPSIYSYPGQAYGKSSLYPAPPKSKSGFETLNQDEMPHFLQGGGSPMSGIKLSSPNRKRVSPPQVATGLRSSRKLILQSIPAFPSLAPNQ